MLELKTAEHEEDDIEKIKEESRRRREAILQKYKAKSLQQQQAVHQVLKGVFCFLDFDLWNFVVTSVSCCLWDALVCSNDL